MKLNFKEQASEKIVRGLFISGTLYFLTSILMLLSQGIFLSTPVLDTIGLFIMIIGTFLKPILAIIFLKYLCNALYKILNLVDILKTK